MRKVWFLIALWIVWGFIFTQLSLGAESANQSISKNPYGGKIIKMVCTADTDGSFDLAVDTTYLDQVRGHFFYEVYIYPTSGGTAPTDASDLVITDETTNDWLGSEDDGATAYNGLNILDANTGDPGVAVPDMYVHRAGEHYTHYWKVKEDTTLTVRILNNSENGANFTVELVFVR